MKNEDSAEGFRSYGETQTALESPRSFRGEQLAPYSEGIRLLWLDMYENKTGRFACPGLIWLMIEMQKAFEAIVAKSGAATNLETAWMLASAEIIRKVDDRATGQATILAWVSKLGRKDTDAATELAYALLDQARESDAKQAAESEGTDGPKSESPVYGSYLVSRATGWGRFLLRWGTPLALLHQFQRCELFLNGGSPESEREAREREDEIIHAFRNEDN